MLLYKIEEEKSMDKSNNYAYMMNLIMEDYLNYFKASECLQTRYEIYLQAIYSCLSKVNNLGDKTSAYKEVSNFLERLNKITGINMQIVSKDKLYVKEKKKRRLVYY